MSQEEIFDIFNEALIKVGVDSRDNVHARGSWHQTFHCWIINKSDQVSRLLLQLRHQNKDIYPGLLDISCAGHLLSGETVEDGVRELEEELGLYAQFHELVYCGMVAQENVIPNNMIDREFNHIFIYESNKLLDEYKFQTDEISGLFFVNVSEFKKLILGEVSHLWTEGIILNETVQTHMNVQRKIQLDDLAPNSMGYYKLLFESIDRVLGNFRE